MSLTYGDLVGAAGVDIHTGLLRVMRRGFVDHQHAQNTVGAVREGDPVVELGDRMLRLRHAAWALAGTNPDHPVVTLHDLAGLGMSAHLRTATAHGIDITGGGSTAPHRLVTTARAFVQLSTDLHDYLAPGPPDPTIRTDILAANRLLAELAPTGGDSLGLKIPDAQARTVLSALHGACDVMGQVARVNATTFGTLTRSDQVHIPTGCSVPRSSATTPTSPPRSCPASSASSHPPRAYSRRCGTKPATTSGVRTARNVLTTAANAERARLSQGI